MLELDAIAKRAGLIDEIDASWHAEDVPLHKRGVHVEWLNKFAWEVHRDLQEVVERHEAQKQASIHRDNVPLSLIHI